MRVAPIALIQLGDITRVGALKIVLEIHGSILASFGHYWPFYRMFRFHEPIVNLIYSKPEPALPRLSPSRIQLQGAYVMTIKRLALIGIAGLVVLAVVGLVAFNLLFTNN